MVKTYTKKNLIDLVVKAAAEAALTNSVETAPRAWKCASKPGKRGV